MPRKIKIFGREIEWYDVKTKFKKILRSFLYSVIVQELICLFIIFYIWFVYFTGRKNFIKSAEFLAAIKAGKPIILCFWHNRLMLTSFIPRYANKKLGTNYRFMTLASNHGDGRFVGKIMEKFGFISIYGSSQNGRKATRGIELSSLREIVRGLKNGIGLGITPDGPRGPNQKINSEIINIAKISNAILAPVSYSASNFIEFNSWDKFKLPLPFSKINFYFDDLIYVNKNMSEKEEKKMKIELEKRLNLAQEESEQF
ncbi:MAG TPA: DUF374 domain-containing protein [Rickettsiales bacterium]|nr:DUF374 domain-containing protein [Rickettsiales bacterium]